MNSLIVLAQGNDTRAIIMIVIATAILIALIGLFAVMANFFWLWAQSFTTGAGIGLLDLIGMWFRRVDARSIVRSKIMAVQAGFGDEEVSSQALEAHYLAGGNVPQVIRALIAARKSKTIALGFREATAIDLAGRDVLEAFVEARVACGQEGHHAAGCGALRNGVPASSLDGRQRSGECWDCGRR